MLARYMAGYTVMRQTRPGFWPLQVVGMLDTMAYWAMVGIIVVTLTDDFGYSDVDSGRLYTLSVISLTVSFFFAGSLIDAVGVRRSLILGYSGSVLTRGALFVAAMLTHNEWMTFLVAIAFILMGPCVAVLQTVYSLGAKVFTFPAQRSAGYNVVYLGLNIGAAAAGFMIDFLFLSLGFPRFYILGAAALLAVVCFTCTLIFIPGICVKEDGASDNNSKGLVTLLKTALAEPAFWRFMTFMILLAPVRASLIYYVLIAPKYWLRMIGPTAHIGFYEALNPIFVIMGTILLIPYVSRFNVFKSIAIGSLLSASSLFFLAIPAGANISAHTEAISLLFILALTIGEFTWAPRLWDYTAAVAPRGLEATYLGVSGLPLSLSKMAIAYTSGYMLQRWCPPEIGDLLQSGTLSYWDSPAAMWLILGAISTSAAVAIVILQPWITRGTPFKENIRKS